MRHDSSENEAGDNRNHRFPFTKRRLESLPAPQDKRVYWRDDQAAGLALCVTPSGTKTFYLVKWSNGRPVRIPLGRFPGMSVEEARKAARSLIGEMDKGHDPAIARQAARHEQTFGGLFAFWMEHAKGRKRTWKEDERMYAKFLEPWASRRLSSIKKADVAALHIKVSKDSGPYQANRVLTLIRAMFVRAADMGFSGANPAIGVQRFREEKRDRFLHANELQGFFAALAAEPNAMLRDFFVVALLTGARRSNVQAMRWEEIDFATGLWRISEAKSKSGKAMVIPLVGPIVQLLQTRRQAANGEPWVFPGRGVTGHIVEPKSGWKRIIQRAGLTDVRPHDLRRSLGSWMAITGAGLPVVGKMLGHSQPSATAVYARLSVDPVRAAAETATAAMLEAGGVTLAVEPEKGDDNG